ncbi:serine/threonine-protein phosphatase 2b catalytic subunit 1 [Anaeramoeba flamelloides]|uniref:Serine/threonine-protein phosphatase n=1 Tax=Anaeramoeba flamelloides TaxID=1746091 RepID=A0ABQ8YW62_9EUKA|nr:serine/threonine-protein phosphatase 2b catalytic subunit 1 [Anaeramoeba flamelloides]
MTNVQRKKNLSRLARNNLNVEPNKEVDQKEKEKENEKEKEKQVNCGRDRVLKTLLPLIRTPMSTDILFPNGGMVPDHLALRKHLLREGKLKKEDAIKLIRTTKKVLKKEKNLVRFSSPVVIFGDLHGKFYDLINYIETMGECDQKTNKYLFLGDYVDRGFFGIEIIFYLFALKICFPNACYLLRGNHECRSLTTFFNFKNEVLEKYDEDIYNHITKAFDCLPLAAIVDKQFFCVHGGISPKLKHVEQINNINRFKEVPTNGLFGDLLWSDPDPNYNNIEQTKKYFTRNTARSCSFNYSFHAVRRFLLLNKLTCVIRAHEAQDEGFKMYLKRKETRFPSLITIFSSPNYAGIYNNKSAVFKYQPKSVTIKEFQGVPEPYWLPKFLDVFAWSAPFLAEKITSVWETLENLKEKEEEEEEEKDEDEDNDIENGEDVFEGIGTVVETKIIPNKIDPKYNTKKNDENENEKDNNIFLSVKRGEIIKTKIVFLLGLMNDFNKIRKKKGIQFLSKKGIRNVRRGHSIILSSVLQRSLSNPFKIQRNKKINKKGFLRSMSFQEFELEDKILLKKLAMKLDLISTSDQKIKKNINDSKAKNIFNNNSFNETENENENENEKENEKENVNENEKVKEFEKEIQNLKMQNHIKKSKIPQVIEIERATETKKITQNKNKKIIKKKITKRKK